MNNSYNCLKYPHALMAQHY